MNLESRKVEMSATLTLTEKEVEMLAWLAGYGAKNIAAAICKDLTTKFTDKEWETFWTATRCIFERQQAKFHATRKLFTEPGA